MKNLPVKNHLNNEVRLEELTVNDYEILLALKGLCVKVPDPDGKFGKLAILPEPDSASRTVKKTYRKKKFKMSYL